MDTYSDRAPKSLMASIRRALNRVLSLFLKRPLDRDLEQEMASHLDFAIEDNLRRGLSLDEARRQAMIRFGGVMQAKELHRETRVMGLARTEPF
jgi:hypothetical protein